MLIGNGIPRVYLYDVPISGAGCIENQISVLLFDNPLADRMYSTLLMAKKSGQTVQIITSGCWPASTSDYPVVISIYVK